jgi:hypothetical protein
MSGNASSFCLNLVPLGIPTLIIADDPQLVAAARAAYAHWVAEAPVAEPKIEIRLELGTASSAEGVSLDIIVEGSRLRLSGGGAKGYADAAAGTAVATIPPQLLNDPAGFADLLDTLLLFLLTRSGRTPVHASAFMLDDLGLVLAGTSGSGKSTLALAAADRGYPVLSDDTVFVQREPLFALWGFPRPIHVFADDAPEGEHPMRVRAGKSKAAVQLGEAALKAERCALVLLERGTEPALKPIEPSAAIEPLMILDAGFDLLEQESRGALEALASGGAWRLTLSRDPNAAIDLLVSRFANGRAEHNRSQGD